MNTKKTFKQLGKTLLILSGFTISAFLFSCSQEEEPIFNAYEYTPQQKAEILALAEKYGLVFEFQEGKAEEPLPTVQEVEHFFQALAAMKSKTHTLNLVNEGEVATQNLQVRTRAASTSETGSWEGRSAYSDDNNYALATVKVKWTLPNHGSLGNVDISISWVAGYGVTFTPRQGGWHWGGGNNSIIFKYMESAYFGNGHVELTISGSVLTRGSTGSFSVS